MALSASIFKAEIDISDLRRHYYQSHSLTLARHPSETNERMMLRLLAFALFADEQLSFTRGLSNDDEPDLWLKELHGGVRLWIELGQPSAKRLRRARSQSEHVVVISYGGRPAAQWWQDEGEQLAKERWLSVIDIPSEASQTLADWVQRTMQLQFTLDEDSIWASCADHALQIQPVLRCGHILNH